MFGLSRTRLDEILARLSKRSVAVVGDFFLDRYLVIDPRLAEQSRETGRPAHQVVEVRSSAGAAGNVAVNLAALGVGRVEAVGVVGDDGAGHDLRRALRRGGVRISGLSAVRGLATPTYLKPMRWTAAGEQELERFDVRSRAPLPVKAAARALARLAALLTAGLDAVVVVDQVEEPGCGLVSDFVVQQLETLAAVWSRCPFVVDSRARIGSFHGMALKPNREEAARALGEAPAATAEAVARQGQRLARCCRRTVYLTLGADGLLVCTRTTVTHLPAWPVVGPLDVTGAGDAVAAALAAALAAETTPLEAAALGVLCAAVTIRKPGCTGTARPAELREILSRSAA